MSDIAYKNHDAWIKSFTIFAKYEPYAKYVLDAELDTIYACYVAPGSMEHADVLILKEVGWKWDEELGRWACGL